MQFKFLNKQMVQALLPERHIDTHKGDCGKVLLLCGSRGFTGAAALAARGALRTGSGLVYLAVPECIYAIEAIKLDEAIVLPCKDQDGCYSEEAVGEIRSFLQGKDTVVAGCGMGKTKGTFEVIKTVLKEFDRPVILDADGINVLQLHRNLLRERTDPTIITPHAGEFVRITSASSGDRVIDAVNLALELGVIVLLKGNNTVITDGVTTYINPTGNPGMAVGGSGDLLAGIIGSLVGQGLPPLEAAACGAWLHGAAGDICADLLGQRSMLPSDMIDVLPRLLK